LSLRHSSHLDCVYRLLVTTEHGEAFTKVFIGSKVGIEVIRQNYALSYLGILQIAKKLSQAGHLMSVFLFPGAEVSVDDDDVINKEERCFVGTAHSLLLFLSHHIIDAFNCPEGGTLDHDNGAFLSVSVSLVENLSFCWAMNSSKRGEHSCKKRMSKFNFKRLAFNFSTLRFSSNKDCSYNLRNFSL
jgi:hypothetical protein